MVTTRRQIRTEQDRFGGYSTRQPVVSDIERERPEYSMEDVAVKDYSYGAAPVRQDTSEIQTPSFYSTRKDYPDTAEFIGSAVYPARPKKTPRRDAEAVMPTIKARQELKGAVETKTEKKEKTAMKGKTKAVLGIYMVLVVALAAIVIATGIAISNLGTGVAVLESELALKNALITEQNAELAALENDTMMTGQATDLGMVKPSQKTEIELLPVGDTVNYEARTNWFDKFCDWLSNLIGG